MTDKNAGFLEVGIDDKTKEVVINHPDLKPDENGVGHIVFSPNQARNLAALLASKANEIDDADPRKDAEPGWTIPTYGTGHHNKDATGRSPEIEGYIDQSVDWIIEHIGVQYNVLDLGCDTGYMLQQFKIKGSKNVQGVDLYNEADVLFDVPILREDMQSPLLGYRLGGFHPHLITLNHSLEHVTNPHAVLHNVRSLTPDYVFIAVPDCMSPWATWESHMTAWTGEFLDHTLKLHGFTKIYGREISFRNDKETGRKLVEIWGIYENV